MGSIITNQREQKQSKEQLQELELLISMTNKQKKLYENEIINFYSNPESFKKYEVVGGRIVSKSSFISATSNTNSSITNGVNNIINGLFGGNSVNDDFKNGITSLINGSFKGLLDESKLSEVEQNSFFIVPHGYTFYRIDVFIYKYNIDINAGLYNITKSCYVTCAAKGILDHTKLTSDELISFASQIIGNDKTKNIEWFKTFAAITNNIQGLELGPFVSKEQILTQLTTSLISNKITNNDITEILKSTGPAESRWLKYQIQELLNIDISLKTAIIISEYAAKIEIYDLNASYTIPNNKSLFNLYPNKLSVSFWCKPRELNRHQAIISAEPYVKDWGNPTARTYGWGFRFRENNFWHFNPMGGQGFGQSCQSKTILNKSTLNKWYHICGTYDSSKGEAELYINGILESTVQIDTNTYPLKHNASNGLQIGSLPTVYTVVSLETMENKFDGLIYDFIMYDRILTDNEINKYLKLFIMDSNGMILKSNNLINWIMINDKQKETKWSPISSPNIDLNNEMNEILNPAK